MFQINYKNRKILEKTKLLQGYKKLFQTANNAKLAKI